MFQSSAARLRSWWSAATEDILGGDLEADEPDIEYFRGHPHRHPLTAVRARREGTVAARPAHCLTPVRPTPHTTPVDVDCRAIV